MEKTGTVEEEMVDDTDEDTLSGRYLSFILGPQTYAVEIGHVTEIIGLQPITEVPDVRSYIQGVINLRGKVIPVMDVRTRFNMEFREYDERTCIIVVTIHNSEIGLIVDRVAEVMQISQELIQEPSSTGMGNQNDFIRGLAKTAEEVKLILDVSKLIQI